MKLLLILGLFLSQSVWATKDIHEGLLRVKAGDKDLRFSGYFDGYYAHDFSNPVNGGDDLEESWNESCGEIGG